MMPVWVRSRLRRHRLHLAAVKRLATRILSLAGHPRAELSVDIVGDRRMRRLNRQYRRRDETTDVLSFAMHEAKGVHASALSPLIGDVVISLPAAARDAARCHRSLDLQLVELLIHGVLHLLGYDHERSREEAARMRRKEDEILNAVRPIPRLARSLSVERARSGVPAAMNATCTAGK